MLIGPRLNRAQPITVGDTLHRPATISVAQAANDRQAGGGWSAAVSAFLTPMWLIWTPAAVISSAMALSARPLAHNVRHPLQRALLRGHLNQLAGLADAPAKRRGAAEVAPTLAQVVLGLSLSHGRQDDQEQAGMRATMLPRSTNLIGSVRVGRALRLRQWVRRDISVGRRIVRRWDPSPDPDAQVADNEQRRRGL
jgi:hypothetical protein